MLRQAVLRAQAQSQRALGSLIPEAVSTPVYGRTGQGRAVASGGVQGGGW